jgi:hypothetical protein
MTFRLRIVIVLSLVTLALACAFAIWKVDTITSGLPGAAGSSGQTVVGPSGAPGLTVVGPSGAPGLTVVGAGGPGGGGGGAGTNGRDAQGVTVIPLPSGDPNCPSGGVRIVSVSGTSYVCNGAQGSPGPSPPPDVDPTPTPLPTP